MTCGPPGEDENAAKRESQEDAHPTAVAAMSVNKKTQEQM